MPAKPSLLQRLDENPVRRNFVDHAFFKLVNTASLDAGHVAIFLGQWWHPLHYFPTFLARSVSVIPDIASKSAITRILNQEVGEGRPERAHEVIYADTMERAGFSRSGVTAAEPFSETVELITGYERASANRLSALGGIFATEVTDLLMVSSIGTVVQRATGVKDLEWVNIHVEQEPDHVEEAGHSLMQNYSADEEVAIVSDAEDMWRLWYGFFDRLEKETGII